MATVRQYFGITEPVPFLDVDVDVDNHLFIDPHVVRLGSGPAPHAADAVRCIDTFIDTVLSCVISPMGSPTRLTGEHLLQKFGEPRETRLGMSRVGVDGHGAAKFLGSEIWRSLTTDLDALVEVGVLGRLEHLPLFGPRIDRDITSDITTRIIFGPLTDFTTAMMARYPQLSSASHHTKSFTRQVWNPAELTWTTRAIVLPVAAGKPLVLVPRGWARRWLLMSADRYYETSVLSYAQDEQVVNVDGRLLRPTKKSLKQDPKLGRGRGTIVGVTLRAHNQQHHNLVAGFTGFVDERYNDAEPEAA